MTIDDDRDRVCMEDDDLRHAWVLLDDGQTVSARCPDCGGFICTCDDAGEALRAFRRRHWKRWNR